MRSPPWTSERLRLASVEITRRCNNHCAYCDQPKAEHDISLSFFVELLDELIVEGVEAVALGGGEPTLHPELPALLEAIRRRELRAGLTTNARDPAQVEALANAGLLESFGVSAGKGEWLALAAHPQAVVNLLLLHGELSQVMEWAVTALRRGAHCLLLLGYKGDRAEFIPTTDELSDVFSLLTALGRRAGITVAADDYTRRRLGLTDTCGEGFLRVNLDGTREDCCFPACEYRREKETRESPMLDLRTRFSTARSGFVHPTQTVQADRLDALTGLAEIGGDALADSEALYDLNRD